MPKRQQRPARPKVRRLQPRQFPQARQQAVRRPAAQQDAATAPDEGRALRHPLVSATSGTIRQLVLLPFCLGNTNSTQRTNVAARIDRRADQCPEFHQRLVERAGILGGQDFRSQPPQHLPGRGLRHVSPDAEHPSQNPRDVAVDQRDSLAKRDAGNRPGRVPAHSRQLQQFLNGGGEGQPRIPFRGWPSRPPRMMFGPARRARPTSQQSRRAVKVPGSRVITESLPQLEHALVRRPREGFNRWESAQPPLVIVADDLDARLLQHDFADPDLIRIARRPPRQLPMMPSVPAHEVAVEGASGFRIDPRGDAVESCRHG